jgi:hypothetical protein
MEATHQIICYIIIQPGPEKVCHAINILGDDIKTILTD